MSSPCNIVSCLAAERLDPEVKQLAISWRPGQKRQPVIDELNVHWLAAERLDPEVEHLICLWHAWRLGHRSHPPGPEVPMTDGSDDSELSGCREAGP